MAVRSVGVVWPPSNVDGQGFAGVPHLTGLVEALHHAEQQLVLAVAGQAHGGNEGVERAKGELQRVPGRDCGGGERAQTGRGEA